MVNPSLHRPTGLLHGLNEGYPDIGLVNLPSPCRKKLLNGVKEGMEWCEVLELKLWMLIKPVLDQSRSVERYTILSQMTLYLICSASIWSSAATMLCSPSKNVRNVGCFVRTEVGRLVEDPILPDCSKNWGTFKLSLWSMMFLFLLLSGETHSYGSGSASFSKSLWKKRQYLVVQYGPTIN